MTHLLYIEFPSDGPYGTEAAAEYGDLAADIAVEDGLVWKVWTESPAEGTTGGVYLFADEDAAARYLEKHTRRLERLGITDVTAKTFAVNQELSKTTHAELRRR